MHLYCDNVNDAFYKILCILTRKPQVQHYQDALFHEEDSRNGKVIRFTDPLTITYLCPRLKVLYNTKRDCNPFFHLAESMWMLAGRCDVLSLERYCPNIAQYSDDGETFNGAYGYRWRECKSPTSKLKLRSKDQLWVIASHLAKNPNSRRAVLQMWTAQDDLLKCESSKDVCCNTAVYFSLRKIWSHESINPPDPAYYLDMTVTNRSNDIIWGMLGANAVHFAFLQEYLAELITILMGEVVSTGKYSQFSNNAHVYTETNSGFSPEKWLSYYDEEHEFQFDSITPLRLLATEVDDPACKGQTNPNKKDQFNERRIVAENLEEDFLAAINGYLLWDKKEHKDPYVRSAFLKLNSDSIEGSSPFLNQTVVPALILHQDYMALKTTVERSTEPFSDANTRRLALNLLRAVSNEPKSRECYRIKSEDWGWSCRNWVAVRLNRLLQKALGENWESKLEEIIINGGKESPNTGTW